MGKASARKTKTVLHHGHLADSFDSHHVAETVLRTYDIYRDAAERSEALSAVIDHPGISKVFSELGDYLRHIEKSFESMASDARMVLAMPATFLGAKGKANDGSSVVVGLDGVVQHTAPLKLLSSLGLVPVSTRAKRSSKGAGDGRS